MTDHSKHKGKGKILLIAFGLAFLLSALSLFLCYRILTLFKPGETLTIDGEVAHYATMGQFFISLLISAILFVGFTVIIYLKLEKKQLNELKDS